MTDQPLPPPEDTPPLVAVYEAERASGSDGLEGMVERGEELDDVAAIARLKTGNDIVVCGDDKQANRLKARLLTEAAFSGYVEDKPHRGRMALPHFHPPGRDPDVHAFFEALPRHARKRKKG